MSTQKSNFDVLPFRDENLEAVLQIERASYTSPWTAAQFLEEVKNPVASLDLLWHGTELAGYHCYWLIAGEMQILNVATAPQYRRQGVAGQLIEHAIAKCRAQGLEKVWLEVRRGNLPAISLYRRLGFRDGGIRSRYYRDGEDALLMFKEI